MKLTAIKFKEKQYGDEVVNAIRTELGVRINRSLLKTLAVREYLESHKDKNGKYDLKAIAKPLSKVETEKRVKKLEKQLQEAKEGLKN